MNERIKEIHKQAFDWVQYQLQTVGSDHPVTQKEQLDMVNQKFGELIVRECARIARNANLEDVEGGDSAVLRAAGDQIEDYFGVEE